MIVEICLDYLAPSFVLIFLFFAYSAEEQCMAELAKSVSARKDSAASMHNLLAYEVGGYFALMGLLYLVWVSEYKAWQYGMELTEEANKNVLSDEELEESKEEEAC